MEDVPQPADEPYSEGTRVRVYLGEDDPDANYHSRVCTVEEHITDSLGEETGRGLDGHLYRLRDVDTGEILPVDFRHADLVPADAD